jgi:hypothetical protein
MVGWVEPWKETFLLRAMVVSLDRPEPLFSIVKKIGGEEK